MIFYNFIFSSFNHFSKEEHMFEINSIQRVGKIKIETKNHETKESAWEKGEKYLENILLKIENFYKNKSNYRLRFFNR